LTSALVLAGLLLMCAPRGSALNPERHISQYGHTVWRTRDGAFDGMPVVVAQTSDGYLWIGTNLGLVRFDGAHFISWSPPSGQRLFDPRIFSILATRDGSLWIGTGYGVARLQNGKLTNYPQINGRIESLVEDADGKVWLVRTQATDGMGPLCSVKNEHTQCYGTESGIPFRLAIRLQEGSSGELWIGGYDALCRWKASACTAYFSQEQRRPETFASLRAIAAGRDGSLWAAIDQPTRHVQLQHFEGGSWTKCDLPGIDFNNSDITTLFIDRDDVLWMGTAHHGIWRVRGDEVDHFGNKDGLSSDAAESFYQDLEGTLWVTTSEGIDSFHDLRVTTFSVGEGLSAAGASSIVAARDGTVWIGNFQALDALRDRTVSAIRAKQGLPGSNVTTLFEDHAGRLWMGVDDGLWIYDNNQFRPVRRADGSALGIVFAIAEDTQHSVWVRAGPNLDRIDDLNLKSETTSPQISTAYSMAANPKGGIILGLVNGDLLQHEDGKTMVLSLASTDNARQVRDLLVESDGSVWGSTLDGVIRWKNGVRKNLTPLNGLPCDGIFALVRDTANSLWVYSKCGLIVIQESQLNYWWDHPDKTVKFELFDALDGVSPGLTSLKPQTARSPNGLLWFVNGQSLQMLDPRGPRLNRLPPPVHVEEIVADQKSYVGQELVRLPALTRGLEIKYTALTFVSPQRAQFRYRLDGHDDDWQDPGTRRQAFYNDLRPGKYTFRVIASNNDGVWNNTGATLELFIAPAWFQTTSFRTGCVVLFLVLLWALYQLRLRQLHHQLSIGLEARVNERLRIARELHDTLLQNFQGVLYFIQAASAQFTTGSRDAKRPLDRAIDLAANAIREGRDAVQDLRSSTTETNSLATALRALGDELAADQTSQDRPSVHFRVEGEPRHLHPISRDEVYRIAAEAIRNAFRHARAQRIEAEILYGEQQLQVQIRDDGKGIDSQILADRGRAGHWGVRGMYERAKVVGGELEISSQPDSGTAVKLRIPAASAYARASRTRSWFSWGRPAR